MAKDDRRKRLEDFRNGGWDSRGVSVDAVIINSDNEIVLIKRGLEPCKGYWALPGGYVDWDETVEQAVVREVKEETALEVTNVKLIKVYSDPARHIRQVINLAFLVTTTGEIEAGDDAQDIRLFPIDGLPKHLAFDHKQIILDCLKIK